MTSDKLACAGMKNIKLDENETTTYERLGTNAVPTFKIQKLDEIHPEVRQKKEKLEVDGLLCEILHKSRNFY